VLGFQLCLAQEYRNPNAVSIEAFGVGGTASFNYERNFSTDRRTRFATARIGLGVNHLSGSLTIPHGFTINLQARKNFFETGLLGGLMLANATTQTSVYYLAPCLGYRTIQSRPGWFFRVYATVLIPTDPSLDVVPYFGVGIGRTFR
jgi:hypothetical protein